MKTPTDRAIAEAFREAQEMYSHCGGSYDTRMIEIGAREIDAERRAPGGAEDAEDAARWRFFREHGDGLKVPYCYFDIGCQPDYLDAEIDKARGAREGE